MTDENPAPEPEIDVDALDDKAFDEFKGKMRAEQPEEAPKDPNPTPQKDAAPDGSDDDDAPTDGDVKTVPHGQFHRERERRKAAEAEREKLRADHQRLMERTQQLLEAGIQPPQQQQAPQADPEIPDPDVDPQGAIKWVREQVLATQKAERERAQQNEQASQVEQVLQNVNAVLENEIKADPSVKDAHNAWRKSVGMELLAVGYTEQQALQALNQTEREHALFIAQNNIPIGDYLKRLASARGWQAKAPDPAPANDAGLTEAEKIAKREELRLASQSLGKGGGAVVNTGVTSPQELLDMSDAEFEAYKKKHGSVAHAFRQAS
jgi:hypothetical protein